MAYPCYQHPVVVTGPVSQSARRTLAFARLQRFIHLGFQHLLQRLFDNRLQQIPILSANSFFRSSAVIFPFALSCFRVT